MPNTETRIAVAAQNSRDVSAHAGRCRRFLIYRVADGAIAGPELVELDAGQALHDAATDRPHPLDGVDALIAASIGGGLVAKLSGRGIRAALTTETDPRLAVGRYLAGELAAPETAPGGSGHAEDCGCHCHH